MGFLFCALYRKMEQKDDIKVCRTCLKTVTKREKMLPIYKISNLLMSYTSLKIVENDGLPSTICSSCHKRANQAYKFKVLCEESDEKLRNNLNVFIKTTVNAVIDTDRIKAESDSDSNTSCLLPGESPNFVLENLSGGTAKLLENKFNIKEELDEKLNSKTCDNKIICTSEKQSLEGSDDSKIKQEDPFIDNVKNNQLKCRFCDLTFMHQTRLVKHEMKHEKGIKCYICGKDYQTLKQLSSHISIHNRKGAHLCQTCGKQFTMPENLVRHQRIHTGIRPYTCNLCNKSFTQSNELKSHMITHSSEKTHLCNVCGNKYARQMSLQVHMRRLHSDSSTIRPYQCDICGRAFKDKRDLSQHTSIHKGERKHICKVCNKAFNRSSNLKVHERIHSGYRPFVCHICQRAFVQKHVLNTHLQTHPNN